MISISHLTLHQLNTRHQNLLKEINKVEKEIEKRQKEEPVLPQLSENIDQNQVSELEQSKESSSSSNESPKKVKVVVIKKKSEKLS